MAVLRKTSKWALLALVVTLVGVLAVSYIARRKDSASRQVTIDEWPDVPEKPAA